MSNHLSHGATDSKDKNWAWTNYLSSRALAQADNVRAQLERTMERYEVELVSTQDERKLYDNVRRALVCGFFMQVAHKEGEKNGYMTVKDNQVYCFILSYKFAGLTSLLVGRWPSSFMWFGCPTGMGAL